MKTQKSTIFALILFGIPLLLQAQDTGRPPAKAKPDSTQAAEVADTTKTAAPDSLLQKKSVPRLTLLLSQIPDDAVARLYPFDTVRLRLYEDGAEFLQTLPGVRVSRSGDLGLYSQLSYFGRPARFTRIVFDRIPWPVGLYGQTNLSVLPEIFNDIVKISPAGRAIAFRSRAPARREPWTHIEYATGPFDVDAFRVRFRRTLSRRLTAYLGMTFSNSDGQIFAENPLDRAGPYDGRKIYIRSEYLLARNYRLRYRFINASDDASVTSPYFFEELPEITDERARFKETRLLNSVELAKTAALLTADSVKTGHSYDLWRLRVYNWTNHEEYRDNSLARDIRHKLFITGSSLDYGLLRQSWRILFHGRLENQTISSPTIDLDAKVFAVLSAEANLAVGKKLAFEGRFDLQRREDFPAKVDASLQLSASPGQALHLFAAAARRHSFPGPGEYANFLPDFLRQPLASLRVPTLDELSGGLKYRRGALQVLAVIKYLRLRDGLQLAPADTLLAFRNAPGADDYLHFTGAVRWQIAGAAQMHVTVDGTPGSAPAGYAFWYTPAWQASARLSYARSFFMDDLSAVFSLAGRYFGERTAPVYQTPGVPPALQTQPAGAMLDAELRLHFKDAIIFFRYDNLFDRDLLWRPLQPMRGRSYRYGINWTFWN